MIIYTIALLFFSIVICSVILPFVIIFTEKAMLFSNEIHTATLIFVLLVGGKEHGFWFFVGMYVLTLIQRMLYVTNKILIIVAFSGIILFQLLYDDTTHVWYILMLFFFTPILQVEALEFDKGSTQHEPDYLFARILIRVFFLGLIFMIIMNIHFSGFVNSDAFALVLDATLCETLKYYYNLLCTNIEGVFADYLSVFYFICAHIGLWHFYGGGQLEKGREAVIQRGLHGEMNSGQVAVQGRLIRTLNQTTGRSAPAEYKANSIAEAGELGLAGQEALIRSLLDKNERITNLQVPVDLYIKILRNNNWKSILEAEESLWDIVVKCEVQKTRM